MYLSIQAGFLIQILFYHHYFRIDYVTSVLAKLTRPTEGEGIGKYFSM